MDERSLQDREVEGAQPLSFRELRKRNERHERAHRQRVERLVEALRAHRRRSSRPLIRGT